MLNIILILATIGFVISLYAYITEQHVKNDRSFKAACDLSDQVSCTKVMLSPYATMFGVSNALLGAAYYTLIIILVALNLTNIIFYAAIAACLVSCYLAYLLLFKIKSFCILCTSLYVVNLLMLCFTYKALYQ